MNMVKMMMAAGAASVMSAVILTSAVSLAFYGTRAVLGSAVRNAGETDEDSSDNSLEEQ
ncbi:hypothetical protein [Motiliproteus sp. MSK22-1]|uniref:hypothetical protein n=1 Tax=Motiliproteus sp. MSK22-1 TaxID=1897630 RepID=UPI0013015CEC|nr:hypothetical protein [Motiliproteus sp. MSK22-1]